MPLALLLLLSSFTDELWASIRPVYERTLAHPFLRRLGDGTLPRARFRYYLIQDALYLRAFGQVLSTLAAKAPREEWSLVLNEHAADTLRIERKLHEQVLASYGVKPDQMRAARMAPVNYAYTNHLLATAWRGSFAEGLAAVLPCYWIYWEVGKQMRKKGSKDADYQRWIEAYAGEDYAKVVGQVLTMMNAVAASGLDAAARRSVFQLFETSARYEYLFWDMAWREEVWVP